MKCKYVYGTEQAIQEETALLVDALTRQCIEFNFDPANIITNAEGKVEIVLDVTLTPEQINAALEFGGYEGDCCIGVNNQTGRALFQDDINDSYIIVDVSLNFKNGHIEADHGGNSSDADSFGMYTGF